MLVSNLNPGNKSKHKRQQSEQQQNVPALEEDHDTKGVPTGEEGESSKTAADNGLQNGGKISASKARRLRKARLSNQRKPNEDQPKDGQQEKVSFCASCCGGEADDVDKSGEATLEGETVVTVSETCSANAKDNCSESSKDKVNGNEKQQNNGSKISASKARRMRKARINSQRKEEEKDEREKITSLKIEESLSLIHI